MLVFMLITKNFLTHNRTGFQKVRFRLLICAQPICMISFKKDIRYLQIILTTRVNYSISLMWKHEQYILTEKEIMHKWVKSSSYKLQPIAEVEYSQV